MNSVVYLDFYRNASIVRNGSLRCIELTVKLSRIYEEIWNGDFVSGMCSLKASKRDIFLCLVFILTFRV